MPELRIDRSLEIVEGTDSGVDIITVEPRRENYVVIASLDDLPDPVSGVITLDKDTLYEIAGAVDIGSNRIDTSGAEIVGKSRRVDSIVSSTTGAVLTCSSPTQNVIMHDVSIVATAGKCIDFTGATGYQLNLNYVGFIGPDAGDVTGFDVQAFNACYTQGATGISCRGAVGKIFFNGCPFFDITGAAITFESDLSVDVVDIGISFFRFDAPGVGLRVVSGATIGSGVFTRNLIDGTATPLVGVAPSDVNWRMDLNSGLRSSRVVGKVFLANPTTTVISAINTPVKVTGVTDEDSLNERFTDGIARLTYTGLEPALITATASFTIDSGNNVALNFYIAKNGVVQTETKQRIRLGTGSDERAGVVVGILEMDTDDYIEVFVENTTNTDDVIVQTLALVARG